MDPKLEAASGDERGALNQSSGLAVDTTVQKKKIIIIGVLVLVLIVIVFLGYYYARNGSLPDAVVPDILQQQKEEVTIKEIIAEEDLAARYASTTKTMDERLEQLYIAFQTSGNTKIPAYTPNDTKLALKTWNTPDPETKIEDGAAFSADGTYSIPANWFGFITIYENGTPIGRQVLDNRDKADATTSFSIPLGNYIPGTKEYRMEIEGAAACRLACSPSDEDCQINNEQYCGQDAKKSSSIVYKGRVVGLLDLYSEKTCLKESFTARSVDDLACKSNFDRNLNLDATNFLVSIGISTSTVNEFLVRSASDFNKFTSSQEEVENYYMNLAWMFKYQPPIDQQPCNIQLELKLNCPR